MSVPGASRAERVKAGRAIEQERLSRTLSPVQRAVLAALFVALLAGAFWTLRSGFAQRLLQESDLTNRLINPERVAYDAATDEIALAYRGRDYRLAAALWRDRGDGEALAASMPKGQGVMVWVPRADTTKAVQQVMAVEAAALVVPVGAGLRAVQAPVRASRWSGFAALVLAAYVAFLLATRWSGRALD